MPSSIPGGNRMAEVQADAGRIYFDEEGGEGSLLKLFACSRCAPTAAHARQTGRNSFLKDPQLIFSMGRAGLRTVCRYDSKT